MLIKMAVNRPINACKATINAAEAFYFASSAVTWRSFGLRKVASVPGITANYVIYGHFLFFAALRLVMREALRLPIGKFLLYKRKSMSNVHNDYYWSNFTLSRVARYLLLLRYILNPQSTNLNVAASIANVTIGCPDLLFKISQ